MRRTTTGSFRPSGVLASSAALGLTVMPLAVRAMTPSGRYGHEAVYVPSQQAMYVVGGEVDTAGARITNEVLVLPLNTTNPSFAVGPSDTLPPHAFASATLSKDGGSLVVLGGMTTNCLTDATTHTLDIASGSWRHESPNKFVRRRNAGAALVADGSANGEVMVVGGLADPYSCATSTYAYTAMDHLTLPLYSTTLTSSAIPTSLTGSQLAVSDFAMTTAPDGTVYLAGGQSASGNLVDLSVIGKWTNAGGWTSQPTTGEVPSARIGATLVAHPTLDVLVLHGGSVAGSSGSGEASTSLLSFLNTTSWAWSSPPTMQPPSSSATAYHSAIMTPSGVMITAFGLASDGTPRNDMYFFDMRDLSGTTWSWKNYWKSDMLTAYPGNATAGPGGAIAGAAVANPSSNGNGTPSPAKLSSIIVPTLVGLLLLIPVAIYFVRRHLRIQRKRRLARHFSFSSQEDEGDFSKPFGASRKTKTQFPFGQDANEREDGGWFGGLLSRVRGGFGAVRTHDDDDDEGQQMVEKRKKGGKRGSKLSEKMVKWEEVDFGLGKLDESRHSLTRERSRDEHGAEAGSRRSSFSATGSPVGPMAFPIFNGDNAAGPLIVTLNSDASSRRGSTDSPRMGTPTHDGQTPLVPLAMVRSGSAPAGQPLSVAYPPIQPSSAVATAAPSSIDATTGLDWNMLAKELEEKPAFRSISPTSTLRSHQHSSPAGPAGRRGSAQTGLTYMPPPPRTPQSVNHGIRSVSVPHPINTAVVATAPVGGSAGRTLTGSPAREPFSPIKPIGPAPLLPAFEFQTQSSESFPVARPLGPVVSASPVQISGSPVHSAMRSGPPGAAAAPSAQHSPVVERAVNPRTGRRASDISLLSTDSRRSVSGPAGIAGAGAAVRDLTCRRDSAPTISLTPADCNTPVVLQTGGTLGGTFTAASPIAAPGSPTSPLASPVVIQQARKGSRSDVSVVTKPQPAATATPAATAGGLAKAYSSASLQGRRGSQLRIRNADDEDRA